MIEWDDSTPPILGRINGPLSLQIHVCQRAKIADSSTWTEWCPECHEWHESKGPPVPEPREET